VTRYLITEDVNIDAIDTDASYQETAVDVIDAKDISQGLAFAGAVFNPIALVSLQLPKIVFDKTVDKIESTEELSRFKNCIKEQWKTGVMYVEHPYIPNALIEASLYKDFIIREMVADVANYITDNMAVSRLTIGLVSKIGGKADAKISVKKINADATIDCNLAKDYMFSIENAKKGISEGKTYLWIEKFPDVISAIEHASERMEIVKKVAFNLALSQQSVEK